MARLVAKPSFIGLRKIARYSSTIGDARQQHLYDCRSFQFVSPPSYCVIRCASWIHQAIVET